MTKEERSEPVGEESEDSKAKVRMEGLAEDFKSIIDQGSASERFEYLKNTFVMLMHKVRELEKNFNWATRRIKLLEEKVQKLEEGGKN